MPDSKSEILEQIEQLTVHNHICLIYHNNEEWLSFVLLFFKTGLARGEMCVCIADDTAAGELKSLLAADGVDVEAALKTGALVIAGSPDVNFKQGRFEPDSMPVFLKRSADSAKEAGFSAFRFAGEMSWASGDPDSEQLIIYEAKMNYFLEEENALALCLYNRRLFSDKTLLDVALTHHKVICNGMVCKNLYYIPPDEFLMSNNSSLAVERLLNAIYDEESAGKAMRRLLEELEKNLRERTDELARTNMVLMREFSERRQREEEIETHRHRLDVLVKLRTDELKRANDKLLMEIEERRKSEEITKRLIAELEEAIADVKILNGLLPICAACKKVRDDKGYWTQIESYIREHSEAEFSHSICPDCRGKMYPDFSKKK